MLPRPAPSLISVLLFDRPLSVRLSLSHKHTKQHGKLKWYSGSLARIPENTVLLSITVNLEKMQLLWSFQFSCQPVFILSCVCEIPSQTSWHSTVSGWSNAPVAYTFVDHQGKFFLKKKRIVTCMLKLTGRLQSAKHKRFALLSKHGFSLERIWVWKEVGFPLRAQKALTVSADRSLRK